MQPIRPQLDPSGSYKQLVPILLLLVSTVADVCALGGIITDTRRSGALPESTLCKMASLGRSFVLPARNSSDRPFNSVFVANHSKQTIIRPTQPTKLRYLLCVRRR